MEERRKIVEGADALLNLAGITTYNTRKRSMSVVEEQQLNAKLPAMESSTEFEQRLKPAHKEKSSMKLYDDVDRDEDANDSSDASSKRSSNVNSHEERTRTQKNRVTVASNRRLRRKVDKKRFKV